jgi:hypothetical protein
VVRKHFHSIVSLGLYVSKYTGKIRRNETKNIQTLLKKHPSLAGPCDFMLSRQYDNNVIWYYLSSLQYSSYFDMFI